MRRPTFLEGAFVALIAALACALVYSALAWILPAESASRLVATGVGAAYLIYLLVRSTERIGKVTIASLWLILSGLLLLLSSTLLFLVAAHLAMGWAVRSLYFHRDLLGTLGDLGLTCLALTAAIGTFLHTGSLLLSIWCLFLVQALFVFIPSRTRARDDSHDRDEDGFRRAHRTAQTAVQRLSSMS